MQTAAVPVMLVGALFGGVGAVKTAKAAPQSGQVTAGGAMTLLQTGSAVSNGVHVHTGSILNTSGGLTLVQFGSGANGIFVDTSTLNAGGVLKLLQSGSSAGIGISANGASLKSGSDMIITQLQSGSIDLGAGPGLTQLSGSYASNGVINSGGAAFTAQGVDPSATQLESIVAGTKRIAATSGSSIVTTGDIWIDTAKSFDFSLIKTTGGSINFIGGVSSFAGAIELDAKSYVSYSVIGSDLTLKGDWSVKGSYLRIDVGLNNNIKGTKHIFVTGMDAFFTVKPTGNDATLDLGTGSFSYVTDLRSITNATTISNSPDVSITPFTLTAAVGASGLDVTTSGVDTGTGVVFGGTVTIRGVTAVGTNKIDELRYIEGTGVTVNSSTSTFLGSLVLVSSGAGTAGIAISANLTTGGSMTLVQSGSSTSFGIRVFSTLTAARAS